MEKGRASRQRDLTYAKMWRHMVSAESQVLSVS
jgi:hypothetical protein